MDIKIGNKISKTIIILFSLFVISVGLRWVNFDRSLSKHHEFNVALILIPMEVWETSSPSNFYYAPVVSYQNAGDKGINNTTLEYMQKDGSYYYLSYHILTYILPYFFIKFTGLPIAPLSIQLFGVLLHFISMMLLLNIIVTMSAKRIGKENAERAGLISGVVFIFSPATLWFFGNGYNHHVLVIPFILWAMLIWVNLITAKKRRCRQLFILSIALYFACITAWMGCLFALIITIIELYQWQKTKQFNYIIWIPVLTIFVALVTIFLHYSQIVGFDTFKLYLEHRFFTRTTIDNEFQGILITLLSVGKCYITSYSIWLIVFLALTFTAFRNKINLNAIETKVIISMIILAYSHHLLLGNFTQGHDFSVLIDSVFIATLIGLFWVDWKKRLNIRFVSHSIIILCLFISTTQYFYINRPGKISQSGDLYDAMKNIGETIGNEAKPGEIIFTVNLNEKPAPQVMYYAKRNFVHVNSLSEAKAEFNRRKKEEGIVFYIERMKVVNVERLKN